MKLSNTREGMFQIVLGKKSKIIILIGSIVAMLGIVCYLIQKSRMLHRLNSVLKADNASRVSIIGGKDGPMAVFISRKIKESKIT